MWLLLFCQIQINNFFWNINPGAQCECGVSANKVLEQIRITFCHEDESPDLSNELWTGLFIKQAFCNIIISANMLHCYFFLIMQSSQWLRVCHLCCGGNVFIGDCFSCLLVCSQDYPKNYWTPFPLNLVEGWRVTRGRTHGILELIRINRRVRIVLCSIFHVVRYGISLGRGMHSLKDPSTLNNGIFTIFYITATEWPLYNPLQLRLACSWYLPLYTVDTSDKLYCEN